jgi:hypothetical protein
MYPYVSPFVEAWLKGLAATTQFWLGSIPGARRSIAALPVDPSPIRAPAASAYAEPASPDAMYATVHRRTRDALDARLAELHTFVSEAVASEAAHRAELDFEAESRRGALDEARSMLALVSREREDLASQLYAAATEAERGREEWAVLQGELAVSRQQLRDVSDEREVLAARLKDLEVELARARGALGDATRERDAVSARLEAIAVEAHAVHAELNALIGGLREELADALRAREQAEASAAEARRALQDESGRVSALIDAARFEDTRAIPEQESGGWRGSLVDAYAESTDALAAASEEHFAPAAASTVTWLPTRRAELEVHFKRPAEWNDAIHLHYWTGSGEGTQWPGVPMVDEGDGWFGLRIDGVSEAMLVFNDGHGRQTADYRRSREGWFAEGEWRDEKPVAPGDVLHFPEFQSWFDKVAGM